MPFGPYEDFADCVARNQDKDNPEAYCSYLQELLKDEAASNLEEDDTMSSVRFQIVPVPDEPVELGADPSDAAPAPKTLIEVFAEEPSLFQDDPEALEGEDTPEEPSETPDGPSTEEDAPEPEAAEDFHALLVVEGIWTGDGRWIEPDSLSWRNLPLPLMGLDRTTEAHMEARLIGNISRIERVGSELHGYGTFVDSDDEEVYGLQRLIHQGELRGISVDLDAVEYEVLMDESSEPYQDEDGSVVMGGDEWRMRITAGRIMGATVVPFPAFEEAYIESFAGLVASLQSQSEATGFLETFQTYGDIDFTPSKAAQNEAERGLEWRREHGRGGTDVGIARARDIANGKRLSPDTVNRMLSFFARHETNKSAEGWSPGDDGYPSNGRIAWALWGGDPGWAWARGVKRQMDARDERGSVVASGHPISAPLVPPRAWFSNPELDAPTPLTVDDEGRIFGHLATWGQCHIGFDRCVTPPQSTTEYAHFRTGELLLDDGSRIAVGQITLGTGHADQRANASAASRHYDHTGAAVADVIAGEDGFGIWVSGALRSTISPEQIRELMASDVSGDWRRVGGNLELVAVLAVNVPGFPKLRVSEVEGLVASIMIPAFDVDRVEESSGLLEAHRREALGRSVDRVARRIGRSRSERISELRSRVG